MNVLNYIRPLFSKVLSSNIEVFKDVPYGKLPYQKMDLYVHPVEDGVKRPTVLFVHGGGWSAGDKDVYASRAKMYALAGFNAIAMNYTLATEDPMTQWPQQADDVFKAVLWIRATKYGGFNDKDRNLREYITSDKVVVAGDSAGAHLAFWTATAHMPQIRADVVVNMFGPVDLTTPHMRDIVKDLWLLGKVPYEGYEYRYEDASPINRFELGPRPCPIVSIHGRNDEVVEYHQAEALQERLNYLGVSNKLITHNGSHDFNSIPKLNQWLIEIRALWWVLGVLNNEI